MRKQFVDKSDHIMIYTIQIMAEKSASKFDSSSSEGILFGVQG